VESQVNNFFTESSTFLSVSSTLIPPAYRASEIASENGLWLFGDFKPKVYHANAQRKAIDLFSDDFTSFQLIFLDQPIIFRCSDQSTLNTANSGDLTGDIIIL